MGFRFGEDEGFFAARAQVADQGVLEAEWREFKGSWRERAEGLLGTFVEVGADDAKLVVGTGGLKQSREVRKSWRWAGEAQTDLFDARAKRFGRTTGAQHALIEDGDVIRDALDISKLV